MLKMKKILTILFIFIFFISFVFIGKVFAATNIIELTNITVIEQSYGSSGQIADYSSNSVTTNNTYHAVDNYIEYLLTIKNLDSKPYSIKSISNNNTNPNIYYEYYDYKDKIINANGEVQIRIREVYNKENADLSKRTINNSVKFFFNLVDEDGVEIYTNGINPVTGDQIVLYVGIGAISLTLLFIILLIINIRLKKKNKKLKNNLDKLPIILLLLLASVPFVVKAATEVEATITFNNATTLFDKVEVTYKYNGVEKKKTIKYNSLLTEPSEPKKKGYTFLGWYNGDNRYDFTSRVTTDITLTAKYQKETFTITYNMDGGTASNPSTYKVTDLPITLENPSKKGYTFTGWTGDNGTTPQKDLVITNANKDLEYTANYTIKEYNITYKELTNEEKTALNNPNKYTMNDTVTLNNPSQRVDKDGDPSQKFIGWKDDDGNVSKIITFNNSTKDKTFEAVWIDLDPTVYSISYILNGGTVDGTNPVTFTKTTETFTLINPTKRGYDFVGWVGSNGDVPQTEVSVVQGTKQDLEFEAVFNKKSYQISYDLDGGTVDTANPETYTITDTVTLNPPTKRGYTFIGWTGTGLDVPTINVTIPVNTVGNRSYTANYQIITYNITYNLYDGVVSGNPDRYNVTDTFTLYNPVKTGRTFEGWTWSGQDTPVETVTVTNSIGDLEFTANYGAATYHIHFDKNDSEATGTMEDEEMVVGTSKTLTKNAFTKQGYAFDKWTTNPDGTGTVFNDQESVLDLAMDGTITLYAKWKKLNISVLIPGSDFNVRLKSLAYDSGPRTTTANTSIYKVKYSNAVPEEIKDGTHRISISTRSDVPTYMWFDSDEHIMYYGGEADVIYLNEDATLMYAYLRNVNEIDNNYSTSLTTKMEQMYFGCRELTNNNDISDFDTSNVTTMRNMFGEDYEMQSYDIKSWDVDKVKNFEFMFNQNYAVTSLDLTGWTTKSATSMQNMFSSMYTLTELKIDTFDTSNVSNFAKMFDNERAMVNLDLSALNTSNATTMWKMFYNMYALKNLNITNFDTSKVTNMQEMFIGTNGIEVLDLSSFDTSKVTNFNNMFTNTTSLKTIYVSDSFVTTALTSTPIMFSGAESLVGGAGTTYSSSNVKSNYAHIDGGPSNPGYFTRKE